MSISGAAVGYLSALAGIVASGGTGAPFIAAILGGIGAGGGVGQTVGKDICPYNNNPIAVTPITPTI